MPRSTREILTDILINTYLQMMIITLMLLPKPSRYRIPEQIRDATNWTLNTWDPVGWIKNTRLSKEHFLRILAELDLGEGIVTENRYHCDAETAFAIMLYRIHYPCTLNQMRHIFNGWSEPMISAIDNHMVNLFHEKFYRLLHCKDEDWTLNKMRFYDHVIRRKGNCCKRVIAFIDCASRHVCRPCRDQRTMFSGHKKCHCFKIQTVATPDGITRCSSDVVASTINDNLLLTESQLENNFAVHFENLQITKLKQYWIYGDAGYVPSSLLLVPFNRIIILVLNSF
jgi:hypothetical protein